MKMSFGKLVLVAMVASLPMTLAGCPSKEGPMERAGKSVDKAVDTAGQKVEQAGDAIQDAAKGEKK